MIKQVNIQNYASYRICTCILLQNKEYFSLLISKQKHTLRLPLKKRFAFKSAIIRYKHFNDKSLAGFSYFYLLPENSNEVQDKIAFRAIFLICQSIWKKSNFASAKYDHIKRKIDWLHISSLRHMKVTDDVSMSELAFFNNWHAFENLSKKANSKLKLKWKICIHTFIMKSLHMRHVNEANILKIFSSAKENKGKRWRTWRGNTHRLDL